MTRRAKSTFVPGDDTTWLNHERHIQQQVRAHIDLLFELARTRCLLLVERYKAIHPEKVFGCDPGYFALAKPDTGSMVDFERAHHGSDPLSRRVASLVLRDDVAGELWEAVPSSGGFDHTYLAYQPCRGPILWEITFSRKGRDSRLSCSPEIPPVHVRLSVGG